MRPWLWLLLLAGIFSPSVSLAQAKGLTVTPFYSDVALTGTQTRAIVPLQYRNQTDHEQVLELTTRDFGGLDEGGGIAFVNEAAGTTQPYGLKNWLTLERNTLVLAPGAQAVVTVSIDNRTNLAPGGHYGAVIATIKSTAGQEVAVQGAVSSLFFVKKLGGEQANLSLEPVDQDSLSYFGWPKTVELRFQNSGNIHLIPRGEVLVRNSRREIVAKGVINSDSSIILPESFRRYPVAVKTLDRSLGPGRYQLEIQYRYDGKADPEISSTSFYFFPMPVIVIAVLLLGIVFWRGRRWITRRNAPNISPPSRPFPDSPRGQHPTSPDTTSSGPKLWKPGEPWD